ncbi:MAG TPA: type II CAAX endopeptidase family protein, partial [Candidatus Krumholzibacterium sp.]|nr:type II CAAX endopeptidase family protein [Candidatus Krumholzibacterium sp.]
MEGSAVKRDEYPSGRKLALYFAMVFAVSWTCWWIAGSLRGPHFALDLSWFIAQIGVFAPSMVAVFFCLVSRRKTSFRRTAVTGSIYLVLIATGAIVMTGAPADLESVPAWLRIVIVAMASAVFSWFLFQRRVLLASRRDVRSGFRTILVLISAWLFYPVVFSSAWLIVTSMTGERYVSMMSGRPDQAMFAILTMVAFDFLFGGAAGEEPGWRGYALPALLGRLSPLSASLALGLIWTLWHIPIDLTSGFGVRGIGGIALRLVTVCPMSIIVTWFYVRFRTGIATSLLLHAGINIIPPLGFSNYEPAFGILIIV